MDKQVILRPWRSQDAGQLAALANNRKIWLNVRDRFPHPYTVKDAIDWIEMTRNQQPVQNFAIEYNDSLAGSIGVILKDDVYRKSLEIGYFVGEAYWGQGIASRSVALIIEHITNHFDVVRVFAECFEHNKTSMKVLEKNGFHLEGIREKAVIKNNVVMNDYVWVRLIN